MKNSFAILILLALLPLGTLMAQENDSVRVKIIKDINGEMKVFERVYPNREAMNEDEAFREFQEMEGDSATVFIRSGGNFNWNMNDDEGTFIVIDEMKEGTDSVIMKDHVFRINGNRNGSFVFRSRDDEQDGNIIIMNGDTIKMRRPAGPSNQVWVQQRGGHGSRYMLHRGGRSISIQDASEQDLQSIGKKAGRELKTESIQYNIEGAEQTIYIQFSTEPGELQVSVMNSDGGHIFMEQLSDFDGDYAKTITLSGQEAGTYFLEIIQGSRSIYKKIIMK